LQPVDICTDTAAQLAAPPYAGHFVVTPLVQPAVSISGSAGCCSTGRGCD